ncbi:Gfo/Idh/MocA family oxidoreductase [bacterium]|nr:MAG: Gfo/Idh/MocA family oxidoreductase [bacterium]
MADSNSNDALSRREVLKRAGTVAAVGALAPLMPMAEAGTWRGGSQSPNDKLVLGLIGCGGMGSANMQNLMNFDDVEIAALCDVDSSRIPGDFESVEKKYGRRPDVYKDYRRILDRKDIDAVIIGTPDHWHALNLIHAAQAGKDSYCEKPLSHNIVEVVAMAAAVRRYNRVVQCGTWQRSSKEFTDAIDYVRSGKLGKVVQCRAWISDGFRAGRQSPSTPPSTLDYEMWTGPAALLPYAANHVHFNWRWFMNYGGGMTTDWGVHMMDIALLGMSKGQDLVMPTSVSAYGGQLAILDDDRTAPDVTEAIYKFEDPDFVMQWSVGRDHPGKDSHGTEFVSADGRTLRVWRGGWKVMDPDGKELPKEGTTNPPNHWRDFVDCVKTRTQPRASLASVAQTTTVCHLANVALYAGETVRWDNKKQDLIGKAGKETSAYRRRYRKGYSLPRV